MRRLVPALLLLLGACAAPRAEPVRHVVVAEPELPIDVDVEDADLRDVVERFARLMKRSIVVGDDVHEKVTVKLVKVPRMEALRVIANLAKCELHEREDGALVLDQVCDIRIQFTEARLGTVLSLLGAYSGLNVIVAADVTGTVSLDMSKEGVGAMPLHFYELIVERHLHTVRRGRVLVVAKADLGPDREMPRFESHTLFQARSAPAGAWFELLERLTGHSVEHGAAPIDWSVSECSPEEVLEASALASRVKDEGAREPVPATKLPSGRSVALDLQATVTGIDKPFAIVGGQVVAEGDSLADGVKVAKIESMRLTLVEDGREAILKR